MNEQQNGVRTRKVVKSTFSFGRHTHRTHKNATYSGRLVGVEKRLRGQHAIFTVVRFAHFASDVHKNDGGGKDNELGSGME